MRLSTPPLPAASRPSKRTTILIPACLTEYCTSTNSACSCAISASYSARLSFGLRSDGARSLRSDFLRLAFFLLIWFHHRLKVLRCQFFSALHRHPRRHRRDDPPTAIGPHFAVAMYGIGAGGWLFRAANDAPLASRRQNNFGIFGLGRSEHPGPCTIPAVIALPTRLVWREDVHTRGRLLIPTFLADQA